MGRFAYTMELYAAPTKNKVLLQQQNRVNLTNVCWAWKVSFRRLCDSIYIRFILIWGDRSQDGDNNPYGVMDWKGCVRDASGCWWRSVLFCLTQMLVTGMSSIIYTLSWMYDSVWGNRFLWFLHFEKKKKSYKTKPKSSKQTCRIDGVILFESTFCVCSGWGMTPCLSSVCMQSRVYIWDHLKCSIVKAFEKPGLYVRLQNHVALCE